MTRYTIAALALLVGAAVAPACERCSFPSWVSAKGAPQEAPKGDPKAPKTEKQKKAEETAYKVFKHLVSVMKPVDGMSWPPKFDVVDDSAGGPINAVAFCRTRDGKTVSFVEFTQGYLDILDGDANAIALILGHELGHHALGHTTRKLVPKPAPMAAIDGHRMEADADLFGARLALECGYEVRKGLRIEWKGLETIGGNVSPVKASPNSHPGTSDRAARVLKALDDPEAGLWRKMAAFENGATFLAVGNYEAAEYAFEKVVAEFPNCHEAWTNLGIARLMKYCDGLTAEAIRRAGLGQFVGPAHYPTAAGLLRGKPDDLWRAAVADLERANKLKGGSPIVLANLGLAYLVHPMGKDTGIEAAARFLNAAATAIKGADLPHPQVVLALLVNLGVTQVAAGEPAKGRKLLGEAEELANKMYRSRTTGKVVLPKVLANALQFNKAAALEHEDKAAAAELYEEYLTSAPRSSPWWPVAYERYAALRKGTGGEAKPKSDFGKSAPRRQQLVVTLATGKTVHVGEPIEDALTTLGEPTSEAKHPSSAVRVLRFEKHGIELIADADEVFAVRIVSPKGPVLSVRESGPTGKKLGELKVGMTRDEVEALLGGPGNMAMFSSVTSKYPYYADLGVAVVYDKDGVVTGLIVGTLSPETKWN